MIQDEISLQWFDPRRVRVVFADDVSEFFDEEALIALSGALSDSTVSVYRVVSGGSNPQFEAIQLRIQHPAVFSMSRFLRLGVDGEWYVENAKFRIRHDYSGRRLAARSLVIQARAAQELGFRHIVLDAVGDYNLARLKFQDDRWVGYWVWPRLGFDAEVPSSVTRRLSSHLQYCRLVSDLLRIPGGLDEWELYGESLKGAKFDLTAQSVSWQLLAQYTNERNIKV